VLTIRHFNPTKSEYEEFVRVHNLEWPDEPMTVADAMWRPQGVIVNPLGRTTRASFISVGASILPTRPTLNLDEGSTN